MQLKAGIYLDSNAGAPLKPIVWEALLPFARSSIGFIPNPSSIHSHGRIAKRALAEARERVAFSLGNQTDPEQLIFTSSGSEANQLAIRSVLEAQLLEKKKVHWITTSVEHDSTLQLIPWLKSHGGEVSILPVDSNGIPQVEILSQLIRPETSLVSVVWVNNETGVISPIEKIAEMTRARSIPLHVDAAQAWGKLPIDLNSLGAQFVSFSGHKIGAFAGVGLLWLAKGTRAHAILLGKQEKGRRGGTENLLGIIALGAAAEAINPTDWIQRVEPLRDRLQNSICTQIPHVLVNGGAAKRVANTLNLSFDGVEGDGLVMALDLEGYSVSAGSACSSGVLEPSHVLLAMGRTKHQALSAVRVSLADSVPWETLEGFVFTLDRVVKRLRTIKKGM